MSRRVGCIRALVVGVMVALISSGGVPIASATEPSGPHDALSLARAIHDVVVADPSATRVPPLARYKQVVIPDTQEAADVMAQELVGFSKVQPAVNPTMPLPPAAQRVVDYALSKLDGYYAYGGTGPQGFDCSGLTYMAYQSVGVSIPRSAGGQFKAGKAVDINELQMGDLVFYYSGPGHVAIYIGEGKIVHARNESIGIVVTGIDMSKYSGARRIL